MPDRPIPDDVVRADAASPVENVDSAWMEDGKARAATKRDYAAALLATREAMRKHMFIDGPECWCVQCKDFRACLPEGK